METFYSVIRNGTACGKVSVSKQGLYYCFHCRCLPEKDDIYRLTLFSGNTQKSLGILVPSEGSFVLKTRVPAKQLQAGDWSFQIITDHSKYQDAFVPICPDEPFAYISKLKESFLVYQNGQQGIMIKKMQES